MTSARVRVLAVYLPAILATAGAEAQSVLSCPQPLPDVCARAKKQLATLASRTPISCNLNANSSEEGNCATITITVRPAADGDSACVAEVPYSEIAASGAKVSKKLRWALDTKGADAGYRFASPKGVVLVPPTGSASSPASVWNPSVTSTNRKRVHLKVKKQEAARWCHYPQVTDPRGNLCCPIDPVISNDPN